jgi:multicomponent Na+:H+ antiporter subunit F
VSAVVTLVAVLLGAAALVTSVRLLRGPSTLDRVVAMDMLLSIALCALATTAAATLDSTAVPVLVVVSLLGFVGAVSIARFLGQERR